MDVVGHDYILEDFQGGGEVGEVTDVCFDDFAYGSAAHNRSRRTA